MVSRHSGSGVVLAVWSSQPLDFRAFIRNDHWDYRSLDSLRSESDPEAALLSIGESMAGGQNFEYDAVTYTVDGGDRDNYRTYNSAYYPDYDSYDYGCFGWCYRRGWSISIGFGWPYWGIGYYRPYYYRPYGYSAGSDSGGGIVHGVMAVTTPTHHIGMTAGNLPSDPATTLRAAPDTPLAAGTTALVTDSGRTSPIAAARSRRGRE